MFFLPIGDTPNDPKHVPWMNYALIGLNVVFFLLLQAKGATAEGDYEAVVSPWAYYPSDPSFVTLFSSMFMHADFMHLAGNMLFLYIFGDNIEARLGPLGYVVAYLLLGVGATLAFGAFNENPEMKVIGASGAISGVQGLYWVACKKHKVKLFMWIIVYVNVILVPARLIMLFWFFMQDVLPILLGFGPTGGGVAHFAHLGGFAGGLVLMLALQPLVSRIQAAHDDEQAHANRYAGGRAQQRRYGPVGHHDRYRPRAPRIRPARKPPPLPQVREPPPLPHLRERPPTDP